LGSYTILVFPYQTLWQYSDRNRVAIVCFEAQEILLQWHKKYLVIKNPTEKIAKKYSAPHFPTPKQKKNG